MRYFVTLADRTFEVELGPDGTRVDGQEVDVDLAHVEGTQVRSLLLDGASYRLIGQRTSAGQWDLHVRGRRLNAEALDERSRAIREMTGAGAGASGPRPVLAPMPGLVVKVEVAEGDAVEPGQGVVIVEAMKMENELKAEAPAVVGRILVSPGEAVEKDQVLIEFVAADGVGEDAGGKPAEGEESEA